ncbi:AsmA family protein [Phytopseudomonas daroniae]|uniref:AsmA family protein n=1 Tax=Phytopseudomonas daroniae TaxID=2487519 RepID=UPI0010384C29|nr:AsmA family protein [Pseudomonas daroniae]TBU76416.1 AsmA family protein [Pseudomonas daroniae]
MMRLRRILGWCFASLLLLIAALMLFLVLFDWNLLKPTINSRVSEALNRPFAIEGNLAVTWQREREEPGLRAWIPWPHVSAEALSLGNPEWAEGEHFVSLQRVEASLSPLPLLWKTVSIPRIRLTGADAALERLADGRDNWTFDLGEQEPAEEEPAASWTLDIGTIGFDKAHVRFDDQTLQASVNLQVEPLGEPIAFNEIVGKTASAQADDAAVTPQDYAFAWQAKGRYKGQSLTGNGRIGGLLALQDAHLPFPVQADVRAGTTRVQVAGTLTDPKNLGALDLRLRLSGASLGNLYPLTGVTLPDTPAYSTDGRLVAQLQDADGPLFRYEKFNGRIGDSDIHGDLTFVAREPRPKLSGALVSNQLRFADLAPLIGADSNAEKKERGAASVQPANKVLPVEEFQTERWRDMDADVSFTGKRIVHSEDLPFTDLFTHVVLNEGMLSLEPLRFGVAGGRLDSTLRLDGRGTPLKAQAQLRARNFRLRQLFPSVEVMQSSLGALNGDATISGTGNSVATLLGSSNGQIKLLINDGRVSRNLMEIAGLNVGNYVVGRLFGDNEVEINCAAANLNIKQGVLRPELMVIDTENALIGVDGTVNFGNEQLDLTITPESKGLRIFSLRSPLYVRGTFKDPRPGVQAGPLALRGAGMLALGALVAPAAGLIALVAPSGDQPNECAPLLEQMRQGVSR